MGLWPVGGARHHAAIPYRLAAAFAAGHILLVMGCQVDHIAARFFGAFEIEGEGVIDQAIDRLIHVAEILDAAAVIHPQCRLCFRPHVRRVGDSSVGEGA